MANVDDSTCHSDMQVLRMDSRLLPSQSRRMDKYKKRNIVICLVLLFFVGTTIAFTITVFATGYGFRAEELEDEIFNKVTDRPHPKVITLNRPNILFITADDLRPTLGCYGDPEALTPNIDQIADGGYLFKKAYAQIAICAPSRTSLLTSRRPDTLHMYGNDHTYSYWRDNVGNFTTLPQYFKENGYYTYSIGKIFHNGVLSNRTDDYPYSWSDKVYHPSTLKHKMEKVCPTPDGQLHMNLFCPVDIFKQPEQTLPDIQSTDKAKSFLKSYAKRWDAEGRNLTEPFFLGVGYYKPHIPLKFPAKYLDLFPLGDIPFAPDRRKPVKLPPVAWNPFTDLRLRDDVAALNLTFPFGPIPDEFQRYIKQGYYASVTYIDELIGELLGTLEDTGLANNTVIVFLGDHGWSLGEHAEWSKYSNFDIALRVPLIVNIPPSIGRNRSLRHISPFTVNKTSTQVFYPISDTVELVDLFPSLVDISRLPSIPACTSRTNLTCTEGESFAFKFSSTMKSEPPLTTAYSQYPRPSLEPAQNSDQPALTDVKFMGYTLTDSMYRYTEWLPFDNELFVANWSQPLSERINELYDHSVDPLEDSNLADDPMRVEIVKRLSKKLENFFNKF